MIQYAKLNLEVNHSLIKEEVIRLSNNWIPHFNIKHYKGVWSVLSLRAPKGVTEHIIPDALYQKEFSDTLLLEACPSIKHLLQSFCCPLMSVRLMKLKSGSIIKEHRDPELSFEKGEARLHIPIITNNAVSFFINGKSLAMQEGDCWYLNVDLPHSVANNGATDRIHLVVDCVVNDWLKAVFHRSDCTFVPIAQQKENFINIVRELRRQNTSAANALADKLENELNNLSE